MKIGRQFRVARASDLVIDEAKNTVEFSFSSEEPVERWFGEEVLSHEPGAMNLQRVDAGAAPFLWNHNPDEPLGMVGSAQVVGKVGRAVATYFTTPFAQEKKQQYKEGLRNISFTYQIDEIKETRAASKDKPAQYTATKYTVYEMSQVSIPADFKVGGGRVVDESAIEVIVINPFKGAQKMKTEEQIAAEAAAEQKKRDLEISQVRSDAQKAERERVAAITALGARFEKPELSRQLIESGKEIAESRVAFLEALGARKVPVTGTEGEIGLTEKQKGEFSFIRALNALANPHDARLQELAKFERECSAAAEKIAGRGSRGIMVPTDILRAKRDMTAGSSSAGGYTIATDLLAGSFIDLLRNRMVTQRLGAQAMHGLQGNLSIPKLTGGATSYWVAENVAPTEGAQTLGQVAMSPKTVGAYTDISRRLLIQSSIDFEGMVKGDLAKSIGLAIDAKALYGDGSSNTITGVRSASNLNTTDFVAATPTYPEIVDMETQVALDNADIGTLAYAVNAAGRGALKGVFTNATYGEIPVWKDNQINGYRAEVSNQVSKLSTADYDYWFGNWSDLILGFWSGLDLLVDPYTGSKEGTVRVVAFQDVDCAVRHGESFCYGNKTIS